MPLNRAIVGRELPAAEPYEVSLAKVREFALALGADDPVHRDPEAARAAGHPHVVAPPTFAFIVTLAARRALLDGDELGLELPRAVHGEQAFRFQRPIYVGDVLTPRCLVTEISVRGRNEIVTWEERCTDADGELVCVGTSSLVSRGTAPEGAER